MKSSNNKKQIILLVTLGCLAALTIFEILLAKYIEVNNINFKVNNLISIEPGNHYYMDGYKFNSGDLYATNYKIILPIVAALVIMLSLYNIREYMKSTTKPQRVIKYLDVVLFGLCLQQVIAHAIQMLTCGYATNYIFFSDDVWMYDLQDMVTYMQVIIFSMTWPVRIYYLIKTDEIIV